MKLKGIKFNKYYTIQDNLEELVFANELGKEQLIKFKMEYKLKLLGPKK